MEKAKVATEANELDSGRLSFSVETRVLRELGERLVKQPEVAIVELIKNAYDADATVCSIEFNPKEKIVVADDGIGMTLDRFTNAWMRIGTGVKAITPYSKLYKREITGEKGIGRFAVRFLGKALQLESVAKDNGRGIKTKLIAEFDWPQFDKGEDLGIVEVPYRLVKANSGENTGTKLIISELRPQAEKLNVHEIRTGSIGMLNPLRPLLRQTKGPSRIEIRGEPDPGFELKMRSGEDFTEIDVAEGIVEAFVLRAKLLVRNNELNLKIYRRNSSTPYMKLADTYANEIGGVEADIRFFPRRKGTFSGLPVDGRLAQSWIRHNQGVAVFDRKFRVQPYGSATDDWLQLQADAASNRREPRSQLAKKHFAMSQAVRSDTRLNWMLRLPLSSQLIGLVCVNGRRGEELGGNGEGLVASADREGFVDNIAFSQLWDVIRGAVEAIAYSDRLLQQENEERERAEQLEVTQEETKSAIEEVETNPNIEEVDKSRIILALIQSQTLLRKQGSESRKREQQLEIMSLLGVVAGFMTHEFGVALSVLEDAKSSLEKTAKKCPEFVGTVATIDEHIQKLENHVSYSSVYIRGARTVPDKPYLVLPRLRHVKRVFGTYAMDRKTNVSIEVDKNLQAPLVPLSLYSGLALNLYTNALKAVTAKMGGNQGRILFKAWNEEPWHYLEVSDTGIGIPSVLHERIFDPLFTTTAVEGKADVDPLGSGMGLGLTLVRRAAESFGGRATVVSASEGFATTIQVRLPFEPR